MFPLVRYCCSKTTFIIVRARRFHGKGPLTAMGANLRLESLKGVGRSCARCRFRRDTKAAAGPIIIIWEAGDTRPRFVGDHATLSLVDQVGDVHGTFVRNLPLNGASFGHFLRSLLEWLSPPYIATCTVRVAGFVDGVKRA